MIFGFYRDHNEYIQVTLLMYMDMITKVKIKVDT